MAPPRKYQYDRSFFHEIDSEAKAYFFGLIACDGWLKYDNGLRGVAIDLVHGSEILEQLRTELGGNPPPLRTYDNKSSWSDGQKVRLLLNSAEMARDFIAKGITRYKSYDMGPISPHVPEELWPHLIRGIMDADGGPVLENSLANGRLRLRWSLRGTLEFLEDVQGMIPVETRIQAREPMPALYTSRQDESLALREWLYQNATLYMQHKHDKAYSALVW